MSRILVVYSTREGQTYKISKAIADELIRLGNQVDVFEVSLVPPGLRIMEYQGVIVGASVHYSRFAPEVEYWVKDHVADMTRVASSFFSVCLGMLQLNNAQVQAEERRIVLKFLADSGWAPNTWTLFAGGLPYTKYNSVLRYVMKKISLRVGRGTDTSRDYEYTDWEQVRGFAREFDSLLRSGFRYQEVDQKAG